MPRRSPGPAVGLGIEDELSFGSDEDLLADVGEISVGTSAPPPPPAHHQNSPMVSVSEVKVQKPRSSMLGGLKGLGKKDKDSGKKVPSVGLEAVRGLDHAPGRSSLNLGSRERREKKEAKSLAGAALIIDPGLESVLDLSANASHYNVSSSGGSGSTPSLTSVGPTTSPNFGSNSNVKKKAGLMGAFKGLRGKKEDPVRVFAGSGTGIGRIHPVQSRDSIGSRASELSRQQSFDFSAFSHSPQTDSSRTSSQPHAHTLAPISTSPFKAQPPDLPDDPARSVSAASKHTDGSSLGRRTSFAGSTTTGTSGGMPSSHGTFGGRWRPGDDRSLDRRSSILTGSERATRPSLISNVSTASSSIPPPSPLTPSLGAITSVLLPSFPATLSSLESIQILSATIIKRSYISPGLPDKEKSSSLRGLAGMLPSGTASANASPKKPLWVTQQLVLTSFKVGGSTPHATPDPSEYPSHRQQPDSTSRTIAHLHLFNVPSATVGHTNPSRSAGGNGLGLGISSQIFAQRQRGSQGEEMTEVDRKVVTSDTTAGVWTDEEGRRKFVMRVMFGHASEDDGEWVAEMRNAEQLHDWIRQIKSVAVIIRAEREGHGRVIRDAYKSGTEADELALELDMERRSASVRSPTTISTGSGSHPGSRVVSQDVSLTWPTEEVGTRPAEMARNLSAISAASDASVAASSAAMAESPLLEPTFTVEGDGEDEADRLARQLRDFEISSSGPGGMSRQTSFDNRSLLGAFPLAPDAPAAIDRSVRPASSVYPPLSHARHEIGPTDTPALSHYDSSSPVNISRRFGSVRSPPPPASAPPTMPLPAIPTNQLQVSVDDRSPLVPPKATLINAFGDVVAPSYPADTERHPPSPKMSNEPRLSLPLPTLEPPLAIPDRDIALITARQQHRAASLPFDDGSVAPAAAAAQARERRDRRERLGMAFRPIPLAPEMNQSPVLSSGGNTPKSTGSPLVSQSSNHSQMTAVERDADILKEEQDQEAGNKTPAATQLSHLPSVTSNTLTDDGTSTPGFFTPSEEPTSISLTSIETPTSIHQTQHEDEEDDYPLTGAFGGYTGYEGKRPMNKRYSSNDAASILSIPSVSSRTSGGSGRSGRRKRGIKPVAVDIMSEFSESPDANYREEDDEAIRDDRPRVIRFAEG